MSGRDDNFEEGDLNASETHSQYHALWDVLRLEFQVGTSLLEEKQEQLWEEITNSVKDIQIEMHEQLNVLHTNIVANIVWELRPHKMMQVYTNRHWWNWCGGYCLHDWEAQQQQNRVAANAIRPHLPMRGGGGIAHNPGRGHGRGGHVGAVHDDDEYLLHHNDGYRRRNRNGDNQPDEEKFGKLKLAMSKFSGGVDSEEYLTWELKVDKVFCKHNYSEDKKLAMVSLEFDDYALIWWEQVLNQRDNHGERLVAS